MLSNISLMPLPACTIGKTFSVGSVRKSMNTVRSLSLRASRSAASTSLVALNQHAHMAIGLGQLDKVGQRVHVAVAVAATVVFNSCHWRTMPR
jgi:hypothetical protein